MQLLRHQGVGFSPFKYLDIIGNPLWGRALCTYYKCKQNNEGPWRSMAHSPCGQVTLLLFSYDFKSVRFVAQKKSLNCLNKDVAAFIASGEGFLPLQAFKHFNSGY